MENNSREPAPEPISAEVLQMQLMRSAVGPVLRVVAESMKVHMGGLSIPLIAGILGNVFSPELERIKAMDFQAAPRGVRKFWEGLCAAAEHAAEIQREAKHPTILVPDDCREATPD